MKTSKDDTFKVLIIAAEASSSLYAQRLLEHWQKQGISVEAFGIGSKKMEALGFRCLGYAEDLAVVGLVEVLKHIKKIFQVFQSLVQEAKRVRPDAVLLLDYPDFNFRLAKKLKKEGFPIYYYISPQVWAWRQGRVHFIKKYINKMLVLFPFEVDFYKKFQIDVEFVGHPLLDELQPKLFDSAHVSQERSRFGILEGQKVLGLMPGSRHSELEHHLEEQLKTADLMSKEIPNLKVLLLVAPNLLKEDLKKYLDKIEIPIQIVQMDPLEMIALTDVVLCASGTATLNVGLMEKPMAIMYKMKPSTVALAKFVMKKPRFFGIVNLILDKMVCREFFQQEATAQKMSKYLLELLSSEEAYKKQVSELKGLKLLLGERGATERVSKAILGAP